MRFLRTWAVTPLQKLQSLLIVPLKNSRLREISSCAIRKIAEYSNLTNIFSSIYAYNCHANLNNVYSVVVYILINLHFPIQVALRKKVQIIFIAEQVVPSNSLKSHTGEFFNPCVLLYKRFSVKRLHICS